MLAKILMVSPFLLAYQPSSAPVEKDAIAEMNRLLISKPQVFFWGLLNGQKNLQKGAPLADNSYVTEVQTLSFDKAKVASLPVVTLVQHKIIKNCANISDSATIGLSVTGSKSWSITKTEGLSTTQGGSIGGSFSFVDASSIVSNGQSSSNTTNLGGSVQFTWNKTISTSTATAESEQQSIARSMSDTFSVGPKKAVSVWIQAWQKTIEVPFHAVVVVDGDLRGTLPAAKASSLLSKDERTFPIAGVLRITDVSEGETRTEDMDETVTCPLNENKLRVQDVVN